MLSVLSETLLVLTRLLPLQTTDLSPAETLMLTFVRDSCDVLQLFSPHTDNNQSSRTEQLTVMLHSWADTLGFIVDILMTGLGTASEITGDLLAAGENQA